MSNLPSIPKYLTIESSRFRAPVSESMIQRFGETANYLLDHYPVQPGTLHMFCGLEVNIPPGYLTADGRMVDKATFPLLYAAIGTVWGPDSPTQFRLPDLRGMFLRGVSKTVLGDSGRDPDESSRTPSGLATYSDPGSFQGAAFGAHHHGYGAAGNTAGGDPFFPSANVAPLNGQYISNTSTTGGSETRPINAYVLYIIKY